MTKILIDEDVVKLALEALEAGEYYIDDLEAIVYAADDIGVHEDRAKMQAAITTLREALAEQPAQQDNTCSNTLRIQGKAYPRTCKKCGLGPCVELVNAALDKKAENARELGLDYEPAQQEPVKYEFQVPDGTWHPFLNKSHYENTVKDERWPIRALYTSPPQRTWVGLTDDERGLLVIEHLGPNALLHKPMSIYDAFHMGIDAAEAAHSIKKNT